jgi:ABC-type enterobactin transport system permease subunit
MYIHIWSSGTLEAHTREDTWRVCVCVCVCVCVFSLVRIRSAHERGYAALHESGILQYLRCLLCSFAPCSTSQLI